MVRYKNYAKIDIKRAGGEIFNRFNVHKLNINDIKEGMKGVLIQLERENLDRIRPVLDDCSHCGSPNLDVYPTLHKERCFCCIDCGKIIVPTLFGKRL